MRKFLLAMAVLGVAQGARAADMPDLPVLRGSLPEGVLPRVVNWQGYYVGAQAGYGNSESIFTPNSNDVLVGQLLQSIPLGSNYGVPGTTRKLDRGRSETNGLGGFVGYNAQWDDVVLGLEASYLHGNFGASSKWNSVFVPTPVTNPATLPIAQTSSSAMMALKDYGSFRARAGYAWGCFLPYMFGGIGFGRAEITRTVSILTTNSGDPIPAPATTVNDRFVYGYSAGLGMDISLIGGLFMRGEYEYARITSSVDTTVQTVRLGLGYKF